MQRLLAALLVLQLASIWPKALAALSDLVQGASQGYYTAKMLQKDAYEGPGEAESWAAAPALSPPPCCDGDVIALRPRAVQWSSTPRVYGQLCMYPPRVSFVNSPLGPSSCCMLASLHAEREVLLAFRLGFTNWPEVQAAWGLAGWTPCRPDSCAPVCSWGGVE